VAARSERARGRVGAPRVLVARRNPAREPGSLHHRRPPHRERDPIRHATAKPVDPAKTGQSREEDTATGVAPSANTMQSEVIVATGAALPIQSQQFADAAPAVARDNRPASPQQLTDTLAPKIHCHSHPRRHRERAHHTRIDTGKTGSTGRRTRACGRGRRGNCARKGNNHRNRGKPPSREVHFDRSVRGQPPTRLNSRAPEIGCATHHSLKVNVTTSESEDLLGAKRDLSCNAASSVIRILREANDPPRDELVRAGADKSKGTSACGQRPPCTTHSRHVFPKDSDPRLR